MNRSIGTSSMNTTIWFKLHSIHYITLSRARFDLIQLSSILSRFIYYWTVLYGTNTGGLFHSKLEYIQLERWDEISFSNRIILNGIGLPWMEVDRQNAGPLADGSNQSVVFEPSEWIIGWNMINFVVFYVCVSVYSYLIDVCQYTCVCFVRMIPGRLCYN